MLVIKKKQVTKSPLTPETLALSEAAQAGILIAAMLQETFRLSRLPLVLYKTDNVFLVETLNSSNLVSDYYLSIDVSRMKEMITKEIQTEWIKGKEQVADCLTKVGAFSESLREFLHEWT